MQTNIWFWFAFNVGMLRVLVFDLLAFLRKAQASITKEAAICTAVWAAVSL